MDRSSAQLLTLQFALRLTAPASLQITKMNAHTRFALPMNTHGNLKYLHDKAQANADNNNNAKTDNQTAEVVNTKQKRRDSSSAKFAQKMEMLFPGKKSKTQSTSEEDEVAVNERKRSTMAQLVGSHALVRMGRR